MSRFPLPSNWRSIRNRVMQRDEGICQMGLPGCTVTATEVDHIRPREQGGDHGLDNLRAVCRPCHKQRRKSGGSGRPKSRVWL